MTKIIERLGEVILLFGIVNEGNLILSNIFSICTHGSKMVNVSVDHVLCFVDLDLNHLIIYM